MWPWRSWVRTPLPTPTSQVNRGWKLRRAPVSNFETDFLFFQKRCLTKRQTLIIIVVASFLWWDVAKLVRHQTLTLACVGSSPAIPARYDPLAQVVEHLTFNQGVRSSSLRWVTRALATQRCKGFLYHWMFSVQPLISGTSYCKAMGPGTVSEQPVIGPWFGSISHCAFKDIHI